MTWTLFSKFKDFDDLILECNQTYDITEFVSMWPKNQLLIDKQFHLEKILNFSQIDSIIHFNLVNLKGIDINSKPFRSASNILNIYLSRLDIYYDTILLEQESCNLKSFRMTNNFAQFFTSIFIQNTFYPKTWCPYFFKNFNLSQLILYDITNSFLIKNRLSFFKLNSSEIYLKYFIDLKLILHYEIFDENILNLNLFARIKFLGLKGILNGVQVSLFKEFQKLRDIDMRISNLKELFHGGNKWMKSLNFYIKEQIE